MAAPKKSKAKKAPAAKAKSNQKARLLSTPVEHIDIKSFDARPIIDAMGKMSFTSRDTSRAPYMDSTILSEFQ